jgi:hypothetical protein
MMKKRSPGEPDKPPGGGESYIGKGYGKIPIVRVPFPEYLTSEEYKGTGFDRIARTAFRWAKETLEQAGLPIVQGWYRLSAGGKILAVKEADGRFGDLDRMGVVKARGFREHIDEAGIAAKILDCLEWTRHYENSFREREKKGDWKGALADFKAAMGYAAQVGEFFGRAKILFVIVPTTKKPGGRVRGKQQAEAKKPEHERWQKEAEKIWKRRRRLSKSDVARMIQKKEERHVGLRTITGRIKKPR